MKKRDFMYFKELAACLAISPATLRKKIKAHSDSEVSKLASKKGTGTYFYSKDEIKLLFGVFAT